ncbi:MAG: hypothetical protein LBS42_04045 [Tannerella sp.]|nr:hypothetical protein [Tannerella sp.]
MSETGGQSVGSKTDWRSDVQSLRSIEGYRAADILKYIPIPRVNADPVSAIYKSSYSPRSEFQNIASRTCGQWIR